MVSCLIGWGKSVLSKDVLIQSVKSCFTNHDESPGCGKHKESGGREENLFTGSVK